MVTGTDIIKGNADHIIIDDLYGCSTTMVPFVLYNQMDFRVDLYNYKTNKLSCDLPLINIQYTAFVRAAGKNKSFSITEPYSTFRLRNGFKYVE